MAEKVYHRSFGRGGGLGKEKMSDVNFPSLGNVQESEQLALVPYEQNSGKNVLKRKKQEVETVEGQESVGQQDCNKKVRKVRNDKKTVNEKIFSPNKSILSTVQEEITKKVDSERLDDKPSSKAFLKDESSVDATSATSNDSDDNSSWEEYQNTTETKFDNWKAQLVDSKKHSVFFIFWIIRNRHKDKHRKVWRNLKESITRSAKTLHQTS